MMAESDFITLIPAVIRNDVPRPWDATGTASISVNRNFIVSVYFTLDYVGHRGPRATVVVSTGDTITVEDMASIETLRALVVGR